MSSKSSYNKPVGVIGAGSFGSAIANILAKNNDVILYARTQEIKDRIIKTNKLQGKVLSNRITPTNDLKFITDECDVLFPIVPSENFPELQPDPGPKNTKFLKNR